MFFRKGKFEFLDLTVIRVTRDGYVLCCGVNGIISGIQEIEN